MQEVAKKVNAPLGERFGKNGPPGGGTLGPILAGRCGVKTADMGMALLSMHSAREQGGVLDLLYLRKICTSFWQNFGKINHDLLSA